MSEPKVYQLGMIKTIQEINASKFSGYQIETDKHVIQFLISNYQQCCED